MPILHVRALPQPDPDKIKPALMNTCLAVSEVYGCAKHQVWATWEEISPGHYVEGDNEAAMQPAASHPPICELICFAGKSPETVERLLVTAAGTLSESLGIPNNIFISYREVRSGQVVAGDGVLRR